MPRYVDKEKLFDFKFAYITDERYKDGRRKSEEEIYAYKVGYNEAIDNIQRFAPTADVIEVVRCKDCIHYENGFCYNPNTYDDEKTRGNTIPNWFCADGERRYDG